MRSPLVGRSLTPRRWFTTYMLPVCVILLSVAVCLYALDSKSLWHDELGTLAYADPQSAWRDTLLLPMTLPTIPIPPLYFVLARIFRVVGDGEFFLRLPSVVFSVLTVPLTYTLGRSLLGWPSGLLGAFLLSVAPLHIRYAQEARSYALLTFLSILSLYLFWHAVREGGWRWWIGFVVATVLNLYTHLFAFLPLASTVLYAAWLWVRARVRDGPAFEIGPFLASLAAILVLVAPIFSLLLQGMMSDRGLSTDMAPEYGGLDWSLHSLLGALRQFGAGNSVGMAVYALLFLLGMAVLVAERSDLLVLAVLWIAFPVAVVLGMPFGHRVLIRYFLFALPLYLLVAAHGLWTVIQWFFSRLIQPWCQGRWQAVARLLAVTVSVVLLGVISVPSVIAYHSETKQNWRDATQVLQAIADAGDSILIANWRHGTALEYYAQQDAGETDWVARHGVQRLPENYWANFVPTEGDRGWLVIPFQEAFLPDGVVASQASHHRFLPPLVLGTSGVSADSPLIGPYIYRQLALIRFEPSTGPKAYCSQEVEERVREWVAVAQRPDRAPIDADLSLGLLAYYCGDLGEAGRRLSLSLDRAPEDALLHRLLGNVNQAEQSWDDALYHYKRSLELDPRYPGLEIKIGNVLRAMGDLEQAEATYRRASEVPGFGAWPHFELARLYDEMGQPDLALAEYEQAIALDPQQGWYYAHLGKHYAQLGEWERAKDSFQQAVALAPNSAWHRSLLADAYWTLGDLRRARDELETAVQLDQESAWYPFQMAGVCLDLREPQCALAACARAAERDPDYVNRAAYHLRLGQAYELAGRQDDAVAAYRQVLALAPENHMAARRLERLTSEP